jgi:hypothetical protein
LVSLEEMRSRVVPMKDMKAKFGAQVESFRYAFVLPTHGQDWDDHSLTPEAASKALAALPGTPADRPVADSPLRRRATDKQPTFIEVRPRIS